MGPAARGGGRATRYDAGQRPVGPNSAEPRTRGGPDFGPASVAGRARPYGRDRLGDLRPTPCAGALQGEAFRPTATRARDGRGSPLRTCAAGRIEPDLVQDRKSTRLNSSH